MSRLRETMERLYGEVDAEARLRHDPVCYPRRYADPADQEVAAVLASGLAYGRVTLFRPVLDRLFALADAAGGPRAWVDRFDPERDGAALRPIYYRWNRGVDFVLLLAALNQLYRELDAASSAAGAGRGAAPGEDEGSRSVAPRRGSLEALAREGTMVEGLDALIGRIRAAAVARAAECGVEAATFAQLPRGFRTLVPRPADGSACKRWFLFLRWMVRPPREGVDLGVWTSRRPSELVVPLDTHVLRLAGFLGLTRRTDDSLRTALEVTAALAALDPDDPVRFDFALAHLGISGACRGRRDPEVCPGCALNPVCVAP